MTIDDYNTLQGFLSKGLYLNNIDDMIKICGRAIETEQDPLPIYVLLSVFRGIYNSWDDKSVTVKEAKQTEDVLLPLLKKVIVLLNPSSSKKELFDALSDLVKAYIHMR